MLQWLDYKNYQKKLLDQQANPPKILNSGAKSP